MKALCWYSKEDVRVENVPDPKIINSGDAIIKITSTAICGSDLHLYDALVPTLAPGDILGHEFMGEVVETGKEVKNLKVGDRVIVPFVIACGQCWFCKKGLWSVCDNTNPNAWMVDKMYGYSGAGLFGFGHYAGGFAGGQAEYARVPFADVGPLVVPDHLPDEKVLFLTDIFPTGYMAAENCGIEPGDVIAIWGCGPVGQFAIKSAYLLGAERVIAIDRVPERLKMAQDEGKAEVINYEEVNVVEALREMTGGRGPDACIDAVGMEAHGVTPDAAYDKVKQSLRLETDRAVALREMIQACRKAGTISVPGVYAAVIDKFPFGSAFDKGLNFKMGQTHVQRYTKRLLERIEKGDIDPSFVITHRLKLEDAPGGYRKFRDKKDNCIKIVLKPGE